MNKNFSYDFGFALEKLVGFRRAALPCATCTRLINMLYGALRAPPPPTAVSLLFRLRRMSTVVTPYFGFTLGN